jgi:hypothetical protein
MPLLYRKLPNYGKLARGLILIFSIASKALMVASFPQKTEAAYNMSRYARPIGTG